MSSVELSSQFAVKRVIKNVLPLLTYTAITYFENNSNSSPGFFNGSIICNFAKLSTLSVQYGKNLPFNLVNMNYMRVILANQKRRNILIEKQSLLHHFKKKKEKLKQKKWKTTPLYNINSKSFSVKTSSVHGIAKNNNFVPRRLRDQPEKNENNL